MLVTSKKKIFGMLFAPLRQAARTIDNRRFLPERLAIRKRLIELSEQLPSLGNLPKMGHSLAEQLQDIFGVNSVTLLMSDHKTGTVTTLASTESNLETRLERSMFVEPDDPALQDLVEAGRPTPINTLDRKDSVLSRHMKSLETTLAVPITIRGSLVGIILLGHREAGDRFPAEELDLLNLLAHHLATTVENARLFESATFEGLTGLLRRDSILERLKNEVRRADRYHRSLSIGLIDLDHFKRVNDTFGHLAGDAFLKHVAKTISLCLRSSDQIGRYGGDEFLFVLAETDAENALNVAEKIRQRVERLRIHTEGGTAFGVTISVGLSSLEHVPPGTTPTVDDFLEMADRNLYAAKQGGRNKVVSSSGLNRRQEPGLRSNRLTQGARFGQQAPRCS